MLPEGWRITTVGQSCAIRNTLRFPLSAADRAGMQGPYPYFGPTGQLDSINHYRIDEPFALIGEDGDHFLKFRDRPMTIYFEGKANVNNHAHIVGDSKECLAKWFYYCFMHRDLTPVLSRQGVGRYKLTKAGLERLVLPLPPVREQAAVVGMLSSWDQAIATATRLLAKSVQQAEEFSNAMLGGRKRFGNFSAWKPKPLSEMIRESRVVGSGGHVAKKLTVKLYGKGVVGKSEKRLGSESTQYYRRSAGQFIYSKLDFLNGAFGIVPDSLDGYESTLDLPAFDFLDGVDPRWFLQHVSREAFYVAHLGLANGGRKARRVNPTDLLRISIKVPCLEEQVRIADAIDLMQAMVDIHDRQLVLLREEKAALMSQLLTGKRRVKLPEPDTEAHA